MNYFHGLGKAGFGMARPALRRSRELTRVCSPKVTHQSVAGVGGVDALRGHWTATRQDLARAKQPENAFWNVASHFSIPRRAFHAYGVDDTRAKPTRLRRGLYFAGSCLRRIVFSVWVTLDEHKWVILRFFRTFGEPSKALF
jgi:hypothetical protein